MKFAVLECSGYDKTHPPSESSIKGILEPFLLEKGWEIIYVAYIKEVATLVGILSKAGIIELDLGKVLSEFNKFVTEKYKNLPVDELQKLGWPNLSLGSNIEIVVLLDFTSFNQSGLIFANQIVAMQLKKIQKEIERTEEKIGSLAKKFKNF